MSTFHKISILAIAIGLLIFSISYTLNLHGELQVAKDDIKELNATLTAQKVLSESISNISIAAIKQKSESENEKAETKHVVRNIVQASECANVNIPRDAVDRLRQYSENIRSTTSAN